MRSEVLTYVTMKITGLVGYDTAYFSKKAMFRRNLLPPSSSWRQQISVKHYY